jgi:hypothetical protein
MNLPQREYSQAYELGKAARRGGKRITDCPFRGATQKAKAESWFAGFKAEDDARRATAKAVS